MITTNEIETKKASGPEKLTVLTTKEINIPSPLSATQGIDLSKMITTHDDVGAEISQVAPEKDGEEFANPSSAPSHKKVRRSKKEK